MPGIQVDGYFPDTSTSNTHHGWNHDSQFVIRLPDDWNGKVVVSGAPGHPRAVRRRLHLQRLAARPRLRLRETDKGNTGTSFYRDGQTAGRRAWPSGTDASRS